jgi:hypothetical protein
LLVVRVRQYCNDIHHGKPPFFRLLVPYRPYLLFFKQLYFTFGFAHIFPPLRRPAIISLSETKPLLKNQPFSGRPDSGYAAENFGHPTKQNRQENFDSVFSEQYHISLNGETLKLRRFYLNFHISA